MKHFVLASACLSVTLLLCQPRAEAQAPVTTSATDGTIAADVPITGSSSAWLTPSGALTAGGGSASVATIAVISLLSPTTVYTDNLQVTKFGFAIPAGSIINGITAGINRSASGLSVVLAGITLLASVNDHSVQLVGTGVTSTNMASPSLWVATSGTASYGGPTSTWGTTAWTTTIVNDPSFGLALSANLNGSNATVPILGTQLSLIPGAAVDEMTLAITYTPATTLATQLTNWTAARQGSGNVLSWTATTTGMPGTFIVEHSANGRDWSDLATITASPEETSYSYTDDIPFESGPTYYRLRLHTAGQVDTYSAVQAISTRLARPVVSFYPNPFNDMINISSPASFTKVMVRNLAGQLLMTKEYGAGVSSAQIPAAGLPGGIYFVQVDGATYKLIKN